MPGWVPVPMSKIFLGTTMVGARGVLSSGWTVLGVAVRAEPSPFDASTGLVGLLELIDDNGKREVEVGEVGLESSKPPTPCNK